MASQKSDFKAVCKRRGYRSVREDLDRDVKRCEREDHRAAADRWTGARLYACQCRSVWCPKCAKRSPTNEAIRKRITALDWRRVRHIILTVTRSKGALGASKGALGASKGAFDQFKRIRDGRDIARTMAALRPGSRWLWILEWHADGYPHWHVFCEVQKPGQMIGKKRIQEVWKNGHVWESFINDENHWAAITGYHRKKGYLAGESKAHQLELPKEFWSLSRVRKYAANYRIDEKQVGNVPRGTSKRRQTTYAERFRECDQRTRIVSGGESFVVDGSLSKWRAMAALELHQGDYQTFFGPGSKVLDLVLGAGAAK